MLVVSRCRPKILDVVLCRGLWVVPTNSAIDIIKLPINNRQNSNISNFWNFFKTNNLILIFIALILSKCHCGSWCAFSFVSQSVRPLNRSQFKYSFKILNLNFYGIQKCHNFRLIEKWNLRFTYKNPLIIWQFQVGFRVGDSVELDTVFEDTGSA